MPVLRAFFTSGDSRSLLWPSSDLEQRDGGCHIAIWGSMTLRSSRTHPFCLVCNVLGIGYCTQDVTSAQSTGTGDGGGNDRNLEIEVIWKELLSQEWKTAGWQCCSL